jgi:endonuclease YncB( thermonuclease family)
MLIAALLLTTAAKAGSELTGQITVIDGDTLEIHGTRIRLWGIDAPESTQLCRGEDSLQYRCGAKAANDLDAFIARRPVSCIPISLDQYRRTVATCSVGGTDLAEWLVGQGLAVDWPQYSKGKFDTIQREAEHAGRGMWRAATSSRGYIVRASERAGDQQIAPTTRAPILYRRSNAKTPPSVSIGRGHFLSEATPLRTACVHDA